jgi:hypothetical protein
LWGYLRSKMYINKTPEHPGTERFHSPGNR